MALQAACQSAKLIDTVCVICFYKYMLQKIRPVEEIRLTVRSRVRRIIKTFSERCSHGSLQLKQGETV